MAFWVPSIAISGLAFYEGDKFPNWKGNAFVGGMAANYRQLVRFSLNGHTSSRTASRCCRRQYRIRDVRVGPDGFVYLATDNIYVSQRRRSCGSSEPAIRHLPERDEPWGGRALTGSAGLIYHLLDR